MLILEFNQARPRRIGNDDEVQRVTIRFVKPLVGIIMGSKSDLETMQHAADVLTTLRVPFEMRVVSAHRTPDLMFEYAASAEARGLAVIIAGAGGAAHLPGMTASKTTVPVLGVPVQSKALNGQDSLLSIVQMPAGIPVGTLAIGRAGAINAALLAASMLGHQFPEIREAVRTYRDTQTAAVLEDNVLPDNLGDENLLGGELEPGSRRETAEEDSIQW
jgi:5-(carboxyamino)imidazole ribonucleotide mutase